MRRFRYARKMTDWESAANRADKAGRALGLARRGVMDAMDAIDEATKALLWAQRVSNNDANLGLAMQDIEDATAQLKTLAGTLTSGRELINMAVKQFEQNIKNSGGYSDIDD